MITAGMDLGSKTIKIVIINNGEVVARVKRFSGFEQEVNAAEAMREAISQAGLVSSDFDCIVATGAGRKAAPFAQEHITEVGAAARGAIGRFPDVRTVLDVGAEEGRAILIHPDGRVKDFAVNEKCAAGSGTFIESMSRALELKLEEFGPLALTSQQAVPMNAQCAVFAESEVVSLLHARTPKPDIARAVLDAIASRIVSMARRVTITPKVALVGGMAYNVGFIASLKRTLEMDVLIPDYPEFVPAEGAALIAAAKAAGMAVEAVA
jgi:benzoyl-CoA reductase subunit D